MADLSVGPVALRPITPGGTLRAAPASGAAGFAEAFSRALGEVNTLQVRAEESARALASGKAGDTVDTVVSIEKANIAFQLTLQMRNKLLEAYQEIMRMQV
ncbi:MAG: flagellar hook-basal body complex protein FliE [candidate division NC10 bacterium]|jgi:flagellar hook-basal body complex protein FliE